MIKKFFNFQIIFFNYFVIIVLFGSLAFPNVSWGVMSSTNYTIFADSIDSGGALSASGTYSLQDTVGESPAGSSSSSVYEVIGGYQAMNLSNLSISIDTATVDLGTLSASQVATANAVVTVTSEVADGYVLSVASVSGSSLTAVSDGTVTAGAEEYGVAVSGADAAFGDDRGIAASLNLAAATAPAISAQTTLTFKASISGSSTAGARSQAITLMASANI